MTKLSLFKREKVTINENHFTKGVATSLTFAGVRRRLGSPRVSVEASFAFLALTTFCVVQTIAYASTPLARLPPRRPVKAAALSMPVTLALWQGQMTLVKTLNLTPYLKEIYYFFFTSIFKCTKGFVQI